MENVRFGIIGIGNQGTGYAQRMAAGEFKGCTLTAICDIKESRREWAKNNLPADVKIFATVEEMLESHVMDAVEIAVPHYDHPTIAIQALNAGYHVLVEKPAGVYTKAVKEMNDVATKSGKVFGLMFNQRTNPVYQKVKKMVEDGELGEIKRVVWEITDWYRSQSYYDSGSWRATWSGEGGGVLLNQCPHQLDLWQWICGMPVSIRAFLDYGKGRNIEVENDVTAIAKYANGATGLFITSTHETPGTNRFEISADRGKLVIENNTITFWRNCVGEQEFNATWKRGFGNPEVWKIEVPIGAYGRPAPNPQHKGIFENFAQAVLTGKPLLAPGQEGIRGVSLANAMHLSAWTDSWVDPSNIDEELFCKLLQEKIDNSTIKKETVDATFDTSNTY